MESQKISRRLSRSAHGGDRRKSRSGRKGNRREAEESAQANQGDRPRFSLAKKPRPNGPRKEKIDKEISRQTRTCGEEGGVTGVMAAVLSRNWFLRVRTTPLS